MGLLGDHQVVGLLHDRHKVQPERPGGRENAQPSIRSPGSHRRRDGEMSVLLTLVAGDVTGLDTGCAAQPGRYRELNTDEGGGPYPLSEVRPPPTIYRL
jgi:hypothetical protein